MSLEGKIALVTGAARGIGLGCAVALAERGARVCLNDRPDSQELQNSVDELVARGLDCSAEPADVFQREQIEQLVHRIVESHGGIDILVSNPAFSHRQPFLEYSTESFRQTVQGTLESGFHISQIVALQMVERGAGGKILFVSSVQAELPIANSVAYNAAKAGLNQLTRSVAVELAPYRINVNAIEPGWIDTPAERHHFGDECIEREGRKLPWGRMGRPADIGQAAAFLVSEEADYITGVVLPVDGGFRFRECLRPATP